MELFVGSHSKSQVHILKPFPYRMILLQFLAILNSYVVSFKRKHYLPGTMLLCLQRQPPFSEFLWFFTSICFLLTNLLSWASVGKLIRDS